MSQRFAGEEKSAGRIERDGESSKDLEPASLVSAIDVEDEHRRRLIPGAGAV